MRTVVNILGLQLGWFACILGATASLPLIGVGVVCAHLAFHFATSRDRSSELRTLGVAVVLGFVLDSALAAAGAFAFYGQSESSWVSPIWMVALWANFGTSLTRSLAFLNGRLPLAAVLGGIAGPLAYWGGASLGAISLNTPWALPAVAIEYAAALPLLLLAASSAAVRANDTSLAGNAS